MMHKCVSVVGFDAGSCVSSAGKSSAETFKVLKATVFLMAVEQSCIHGLGHFCGVSWVIILYAAIKNHQSTQSR